MTSRQISLPAVVGEILDIDVMDITVGDRLRPVDPEWAKALAGIISAEGQRTPIEVCRLPGRKGFTLVAGAHRLEAMRDHLCRVHIAAIVVDADKIARRSREVSENLWRKGLDPLDRAAFIAELVTLHKIAAGIDPAKDGRIVSAAARWKKDVRNEADDATAKLAVAYGWGEQVGERLGLSSRTIRRELTLHKRLLPDVAQLLRGHAIAKNASQMTALASLEPAPQREIAAMIAAGTARTVAAAKGVQSQKPKPDAETKRFSAVIGNLGRMGASERQAVLDQIAGMYFQAARRAVAKAGGEEQV